MTEAERHLAVRPEELPIFMRQLTVVVRYLLELAGTRVVVGVTIGLWIACRPAARPRRGRAWWSTPQP
ncbi:hypothetical protein [Streptomyces sp. 2A115]|uniref:hypothetical protein n=1 Tax=Streptomyces sp. 2A115 TaxID=3457439 RepID=UPI003FD2E193